MACHYNQYSTYDILLNFPINLPEFSAALFTPDASGGLEQRFSTFHVYQNRLKGLLKHSWVSSKILVQYFWNEAPKVVS
jgi:hypothetical protein